MYGWFVDVAGATLGPVLFWLAAAILLGLLFLAMHWLLRRAAFGTFPGSSRNRKQRLAVVDVAAVDSRRRLLLIRRDDVEHLVMIGGPGDIVIEQGIRKKPVDPRILPESPERPSERSAQVAPAVQPAMPPVAGPAMEPAPVAAAKTPEISVAPEPPAASPRRPSLMEPLRDTMHEPPMVEKPVRPPQPQAPTIVVEKSAPARVEPSIGPDVPAGEAYPANADFDSELLRELQSTLEEKPRQESDRAEDTLSNIFADIIRRHRS